MLPKSPSSKVAGSWSKTEGRSQDVGDRVVERARVRARGRSGKHRPRIVDHVAGVGAEELACEIVTDPGGDPACAEAAHQKLVDARKPARELVERRDRVVVAVVVPDEIGFLAEWVDVRGRAVADVDVTGAVRHVDDIPALGDDVGSRAERDAGVGAVDERRYELRKEPFDVVVGKAVAIGCAEDAEAAAARIVVPARAAALEIEQEVV